MPLENTIILPENDLGAAQAAFESALSHDKISIIIFGETEKSELAATVADNLANAVTAGFHRQVIWMKNLEHWDSLKNHLGNGSIHVNSVNPAQTICISLTLSNKAEYALDISKTPDNITLTLVFLNASKA